MRFRAHDNEGFFSVSTRFRTLALTAAFVTAVCSTQTAPQAALAQSATYISGTVTNDGKPVPNAAVTLTGPSLTFHTRTDARGTFAFNALTVGTYQVSVAGPNGPVSTTVNLGAAGTTVTLDETPLRTIGHAAVVAAPPVRASGTDLVVTGSQLAHAAVANSLPDILTQIPSAARGSNGQIHINGDHNGLNYVVDGVEIPEGLNRVLGNEIDPSTSGSPRSSRAHTRRSTAINSPPSSTSRPSRSPARRARTSTCAAARTICSTAS